MRRYRLARFVVAALVSLLVSSSLHASTVMQLNLSEMVQRAASIYRGTVLSATASRVAAGGGELPIVTYRLQVEEVFRGEFRTVKGVTLAEIRTLGKINPLQRGNLRFAMALPSMPDLQVGQAYLVMTTRPSAIGLSTTVGLGQGCFRIAQVGKSEQAVNEVNNSGLFRDMTAGTGARAAMAARSARPPAGGPMPYSDLASQIRSLTGR